MNTHPVPHCNKSIFHQKKSVAHSVAPLCDTTLVMIDQAVVNDQRGVLGRKFDLNEYKALLEETDDE